MADWNSAFTPEALESAVTMQHFVQNRTFVRVEMLSKAMMQMWFDLMKTNQPRLVYKEQLSTRIAGPCKLYMCYLTSNHTKISDPTSISCIVPTYIQQPYVCFQGLMRLNKTFVGPSDADEQLTLIVMASRMAPQKEGLPFKYIFFSPVPYVGSMLRNLLKYKGVEFSQCLAGALYGVEGVHSAKKCQCGLEIGDWNEVDIHQHKGRFEFILPRLTYKDDVIGCINVPWVSGRSFDIIGQNGWVVDDAGIAALTGAWYKETDYLEKTAKSSSFLSILIGIDGIHVIDYVKFITIDPLEVKMAQPSDQASGSKP
jgi:hypothetical protein